MKVDYQLKHGMFGRVGSMWSRQVDNDTRIKARAVVGASGSSNLLRRLDLTASTALQATRVLVDDTSFRFNDGDFAVIGRSQTDYDHSILNNRDTPTLDDDPLIIRTPVPNKLARLDAHFVKAIEGSELRLDADSDWYLIPIPTGMTPIVIASKYGDALVSGIDFSAHRGFIATREDPALMLPVGLVRVISAYVDIPPPHSFILGAPPDRLCSKYLMDYSKRTQSLKSFRLAAAEYCGMYVFDDHDIILSRHHVQGAVVYITAARGGLRIDYPHTHMEPGDLVSPGTVVSLPFEVTTFAEGAATYNGYTASLDGVLPVKGLSYTLGANVVADYQESTFGKPHARLHFDGSPEVLVDFWKRQKRHDIAGGEFLFDQIFEAGQTSIDINMDQLLISYYGSQLVMLIVGFSGEEMTRRLLEFTREHKPESCVMVTTVLPV